MPESSSWIVVDFQNNILQIGDHLITGDEAKLPVLVAAPQEAVRVIPGEEALIDCIVRDVGNYTVLWKHRLREPGITAVERVLTANKVRLVDDKVRIVETPTLMPLVVEISSSIILSQYPPPYLYRTEDLSPPQQRQRHMGAQNSSGFAL